MKKFLFTFLMIAFVQTSYTQNYKFGKVSKEEISEKVYSLDSTANAAYLYKKRTTYTSKRGASLQVVTEVHVRLKLYNQNGFNWATEKIDLFGGASGEKVSKIKGYTYNIVDGKVVKTKLEKADVFTEKKSENYQIKKFTMPNVKEGSVLEWTYTVTSPFLSTVDDVVVQYEIPVKRLEAKIQLLEYFNFNKRQKGYYPFKILESTKNNSSLGTKDKVIEIKENNIPALKPEPYVNSMVNYTAALQLEIASLIAYEFDLHEEYSTSWEQIAHNIFEGESFGRELKKTKHLEDDVAILKKELIGEDAKIRGALKYVKEKIKWNEHYGFVTEEGVKKAYKEGTGNIGDINLTLVTVLRELGLKANPVIISTREHGVSYFPTIRGLNYVIAVAQTAQGKVLLDASEKYSLPNVLPLRALNGRGMEINNEGLMRFIDLKSSAVSKNTLRLNYTIDSEGLIGGLSQAVYENLESINYRNKNSNLNNDKIISKLEQKNGDIEILDFRLKNLKDLSKPIVEMYKFEKEDGAEIIGDKMYISPLLFNAINENPFKLDTREYPIDYGSPREIKNMATIKIPEGYKVEFIPESVRFLMTDDVAEFVFIIKNLGNVLQVSAVIKINNGIIPAIYYKEFKEFNDLIVKKSMEKIVLKK